MTAPLYNRDILRLAATIPHLRALANPHGRSERRSPVCGSRVVVEVRLDESGRVAELGQAVSACALGQASAALMGAHAIGRTHEELAQARDSLRAYLQGVRQDPGSWPGVAILERARPYAARHASILLPFEAAAEATAAARA